MTGNRGFTLPEMLIAMAISVIVGMAGYTVYQSSSRTYVAQQDIVEEQQNLRISMERILRDLRTAGFGLPDPPFLLTIGGQSFDAPIKTSDSATGSDAITIVGIGHEVGQVVNENSVVCDNGTGCNRAGANCICLSDVSSLFDSSHTFLTNRRYTNISGALFQVLDNAGHDESQKMVKLASPATLARTIADTDKSSLYIIQAIQYAISTTAAGCSAINPCLTSQDYTGLRGTGVQVFADNIEDMQIAYGLDGSMPPYKRDGLIDDKNANAVFDEKDYRFSENTDVAISDPTTIIAARIMLTAKGRNPDIHAGNVFKRPAVENRAEGALEQYRRRALTSVIKLRNPRVPH